MKKQELYNKLVELSEVKKSEELRSQLLELAESIKPKTRESGPKSKKHVHVFDFIPDENEKWPKQAIAVHRILTRMSSVSELPLAELKQRLDSKPVYRRVLKTKQAPSRIYSFYQKRLIDAGAISHEDVEIAA